MLGSAPRRVAVLRWWTRGGPCSDEQEHSCPRRVALPCSEGCKEPPEIHQRFRRPSRPKTFRSGRIPAEVSTTVLPYQREFIDLALARQALRFGSFTLKSGRISP